VIFSSLELLGDQGWLARFKREADAILFSRSLNQARFSWVRDVVPAYFSVAVFTDPKQISLREAEAELNHLPIITAESTQSRRFDIPVCYELGPDLKIVAKRLRLTTEDVIDLHTGYDYTIYAIGFCPGFPYLGYLPDALQGVPRLASPRVEVPAGSVGLTGKQTGVYPIVRPGGWHLIGQTPLKLVDVEEDYFPLLVGDQVRFTAISEDEFHEREGNRL
jgi:inhibitor of KinA